MATGREGLAVDKRALMAMGLLPVAYVLAYRVLAQLATKAVVAIDSSVYNQGLSLVIGIACALAAALACVHVHLRAVGALPVGRAFVMGAIAIPILMLVHFFSMGIVAFGNFLMQTPLNALLRYTIVFLALPVVAVTWRRTAPRREEGFAGETLSEPAPAPSSAGLVLLRIFIALVSVLAFLGWGVVFVFIRGMGGGGRSDPMVMALFTSPLVLLAGCFLTAVGLFGPSMLRIVRPVGAVLWIPFMGWLAMNEIPGATAAAVLFGFVALWWLMCRWMEARA
jgi:hypothetical protein